MEPIWLEFANVEQTFCAFAGSVFLVKPQALQSAFFAPQNAYMYAGEESLYKLAALYAVRIAKAHALADGNKRLAVFTCLMFLEANKAHTAVTSIKLADGMVSLAAGQMTTEQFAALLQT